MRIQLTLRNKMFLFFSVVMPFGFFFLYAGVFAKGVPDKVSYLMGPVVWLTVMGSFWGLSAALVTVSRARDSATVSCNAGYAQRHAGIQHRGELFSDTTHRIDGNAFCAELFFHVHKLRQCPWQFSSW